MFKRSKETQATTCYNDDRYHIVFSEITTLQPKGILKKYSVVRNVKDLSPLTVKSNNRSEAIDVDTNERIVFYGYERSNIKPDEFLIKNYDILNAKEREKYVKAAVKYEKTADVGLIWGAVMTMLVLLSQISESCIYVFTAFMAIKIIRILISWIRLKRIKNVIVEKAEMYRQDFQEQHINAVVDDIHSLSNVINSNFHNEKVTVWHCCTSDGHGYYTVSNGTKKRFVHSEYGLECVGGVWSLHVYERLYMGQVNLMKFLETVKAEICKNFSVEMPLKTLYIAYILTDLDKWENSLKDEYYHKDDKRNFENERKYQKEFKSQYPEQIEIYNNIVANGGDFWDYYNGTDNYEYSCVSNILENAVSEIYKNREQLEVCGLWKKARETIDILYTCKYNGEG